MAVEKRTCIRWGPGSWVSVENTSGHAVDRRHPLLPAVPLPQSPRAQQRADAFQAAATAATTTNQRGH